MQLGIFRLWQGGAGTGLQIIVAKLEWCNITEVFIPNNYRGTGYADNDAVNCWCKYTR